LFIHDVFKSFLGPTLSIQNSENFLSAGEMVLYLGSKLLSVLNLVNPLGLEGESTGVAV